MMKIESMKNHLKFALFSLPKKKRVWKPAPSGRAKTHGITDEFGPPKEHQRRESEKHRETQSQMEGAKTATRETLEIA